MTQQTTHSLARQVYRHLLQSTKLAFEGDKRLLTQSRTQIRQKFEENRSLDENDPKLVEWIKHGDEVAKYLRENVVQGRLVDGEGEDEGEKYKLRIHKYTERRDNGTHDVDFMTPGTGCGGGKGKKVEVEKK